MKTTELSDNNGARRPNAKHSEQRLAMPREQEPSVDRRQSGGAERSGGFFNVNLGSVGEGTCRTSATYIALLASLEGDRHGALAVLASAAEHLGITGDEIEHRQRLDEVPGCTDEAPRAAYDERSRELKAEAQKRYPNVR